MNFSVVINTYNAEKYLHQVLDAVKGENEIVICDMHSTDKTFEIANGFGCKIVNYHKSGEQVGFCEPARNTAIQAAKNDWVLLLDADEIAPAHLLDYCRDHITKANPEAGIFIPIKSFLHGVFMHASYPGYSMRFFKKNACYWPPEIHSIPRINGSTCKIPRKNKDLFIIHLDDQNIHDRIEKQNHYATKEVERMYKNRRKFGRFSMIGRPLFFFIKFYFFKGGIRDGKMGLVYSLLHTFSRFIAMAKLWEKEYLKNT